MGEDQTLWVMIKPINTGRVGKIIIQNTHICDRIWENRSVCHILQNRLYYTKRVIMIRENT